MQTWRKLEGQAVKKSLIGSNIYGKLYIIDEFMSFVYNKNKIVFEQSLRVRKTERYEEVQCALNCSPYIYRHKLIIYLQTFKVSFTPSTIKWVGIPFSSLHTYCIGYSSTDCLLHSCLLYIYGISFAVCFRIPRNIPHTKSLLLLLSCFRTHVNFADNEVPQK